MNLKLEQSKKYIFFIAAVFLVVFLAFYFFQKPGLVEKTADRQAELKAYLENETPQQKLAGEQNADYESVSKAVKKRDTSLCAQLNDKGSFDNCIWAIAVVSNDSEFCQEIKDEGLKKKCLEFLVLGNIIKGTNVDECQQLTNEEIRKDCQLAFFWKWEEVSECNGFKPDEKKICLNIVLKKQAYRKNDPKICNQITDSNLLQDCQQSVANKPEDADNDGLANNKERSFGTDPFTADTDGDGLDDFQEIMIYHTNPNKADTDGDGFSDSEEVKKGFNPNGEGLIKK